MTCRTAYRNPAFLIANAHHCKALGAGDDDRPHRERYRMVYVLVTGRRHRGDDDPSGTGVFLSRADAEEACALITPKVTDCWIETLPIAI